MSGSPLNARNRNLVTKLIKLGAFATASVVLTAVVVASLLDLQTTPTSSYKAQFSDASGLQSGDPVRIAGVKVGRVTGVRLDGSNALITFTVASNQTVTRSTRLQIHYETLLGQRNLALLAGTGSQQPIPKHAVIPMTRTTPALDLSDLFNGFQPLYAALTPDQVNQLTANIIGAFQGESVHISGLITQAANLTTNLADRTQVINQVVDNLAQLLHVVGGHDQQVGQLIDGFAQLTGQVAGERNLIGDALGNTSQMVTSLNDLFSAVQPPLQQSIAGLDTSLGSLATNQNALDGLLREIPPSTAALARTLQNGTWSNVYLCQAQFNVTGPIKELPATANDALDQLSTQFPVIAPLVANVVTPATSVYVHGGIVGNNGLHTPICHS